MFFAYIEPSALSFVIQAIVGTLLAFGAVTGVIVTFVKKRAAKALGIQQGENKEIEEDIIITSSQHEKGK